MCISIVQFVLDGCTGVPEVADPLGVDSGDSTSILFFCSCSHRVNALSVILCGRVQYLCYSNVSMSSSTSKPNLLPDPSIYRLFVPVVRVVSNLSKFPDSAQILLVTPACIHTGSSIKIRCMCTTQGTTVKTFLLPLVPSTRLEPRAPCIEARLYSTCAPRAVKDE